jgi:hypothetical protein
MMIFGGLPFLAISILVVNVRMSSISREAESMIGGILVGGKLATSISIAIFVTGIIYFGIIVFAADFINGNFDWWIFGDGLKPTWYFYVIFGILVYKTAYELWKFDYIPTTELGKLLENWFVVCFTVISFFALLVGGIFIIFHGFIIFEILPKSTKLGSVPYLWGVFIVLIELFLEVDPEDN